MELEKAQFDMSVPVHMAVHFYTGTHVLSVNANVHCMCSVCRVCCPKLAVNKNWWCGAGQTLMSMLDGLSCVP